MSVKDADGNIVALSTTFRVDGEYRSAAAWRDNPKNGNLCAPSRKALCLEVHDETGTSVCRVHLERTTLREFLREALALIEAEDL